MMIKFLAITTCFILTGCAYKESTVDADCTAVYTLKTFVVGGDYPVKINAVRHDRFGRVYYRAAPGQSYVNFYGRWQPATSFTHGDCPR